MKKETIRFLNNNLSDKPSTFEEEARQRQKNKSWEKWSRMVAVKIIDYMQENNLSRSDVAYILNCSPQYVSRILSGTTNFSIRSLAEIEQKLGVNLLNSILS